MESREREALKKCKKAILLDLVTKLNRFTLSFERFYFSKRIMLILIYIVLGCRRHHGFPAGQQRPGCQLKEINFSSGKF